MSEWPTNKSYFGLIGPDTLKVQLQPYKILRQDNNNAANKTLKKSSIGSPMIFLMPYSFSTTINHEWASSEQLGQRLAQKGSSLKKQASEVKGLIQGNKITTNKHDTPLTYKNSTRRSLTLTVILVDQGNSFNDVFAPVRSLEKYSCADKEGGIKFAPPEIFTVKTLNSDLVYMENAALISVQPTYFGPYRGGYPSKCELTLEFKDIDPLYKTNFG